MWLWVADRGAGRVLGLDAALVPRVVAPGPAPGPGPERLVAAAGGGAWVARAGRARSLLRLDAAGRVVEERGAARLADLCADARGGPWLLCGAAGDERLVLPDGVEVAPRVGGARHLALAETRRGGVTWLVAGGERGELAAGQGDVVLSRGDLGEPVLGAAADGSGFTLLCGGSLARVPLDLASVERRALVEPPGVLVGSRAGGVWHVAGNGRGARLMRRGARDVWIDGLTGAWAGAALPDGGIALVHPGAVVVASATGRLTASQGGFRELVSAAAALAP